nr:hypothetical protein [Tanacetum cinerariifolium]
MQDIDEEESAKVEEVLEVVTAAKLITEVVTTSEPTIAVQVPKASALRRRRGVVIQDPEETATSVIMHTELAIIHTKGTHKEESFKQGRIIAYMDEDVEASALRRRRGVVIQDPEETATSVIMHTENDVMEQVKRSKRQNNAVMRYQALKRKPLTEAQERKNMMIYIKNMADFKMNFFKGMTYSEIRPLFEKHCNSNQAFLEKVKEEVTV